VPIKAKYALGVKMNIRPTRAFRYSRYHIKTANIDAATAMNSVRSKATGKALRSILEKGGKIVSDEELAQMQNKLEIRISDAISYSDIPDKYKGSAIIWLKNYNLQMYGLLDMTANTDAASLIEKFYLFHNFVPADKKDLHAIHTITDLSAVVDQAQETEEEKAPTLRGQNYRQQVAAGLEKLGEDDEWIVYSPHNKEAACHIGAGTRWCTSSRGENNMFSAYYDPNDQLYVFINKANPKQKYQFHYNSKQFKDANDIPITSIQLKTKLETLLHNLTGHLAVQHGLKLDQLVKQTKDMTDEELSNTLASTFEQVISVWRSAPTLMNAEKVLKVYNMEPRELGPQIASGYPDFIKITKMAEHLKNKSTKEQYIEGLYIGINRAIYMNNLPNALFVAKQLNAFSNAENMDEHLAPHNNILLDKRIKEEPRWKEVEHLLFTTDVSYTQPASTSNPDESSEEPF